MREPLLRATIAAVSGALKDASGPPLRDVARRIKAELEALPAGLCALASAHGVADDLARQRRPAFPAAAGGTAGGGAEDGLTDATQEGEQAEQERQQQQHQQQQQEDDGGWHEGGGAGPTAAAAAAPAPPPAPSFPSAHGAQCSGAAWQVALGTCFGTAVSFETRGFAHLRAGSTHVVVWRSRDALPKKPPPPPPPPSAA